ncbi:MAG TPA: hypothetical protein VJN18_27145 [Polyangiaceae bacterium]|nr:hypothetical protein [Polyangiaceae bacterium]
MTKRDDSEADEKKEKVEGKKEKVEGSEEEPKQATARGKDDEDEDDEDDDEDEEPAAVASSKPSRKVSTSTSERSAGRRERAQARAPRPAGNGAAPMKRVVLFVVVALAAGGAAGWFGHEAQAKARVRAEAEAVPAGSGAPAGACGAWQKKLCDTGGDTSAICTQAKGATELLTASGCEAGLAAMPATLTKVKAMRASCDTLVGRLCKDLPPGSPACSLVKEKTPAFPSQRCEEMLKHYDEVLGSLQQIDQQGGAPMPGHGGPGMRPPGMPAPAH